MHSGKEIENILYSGIRNSHHRKIRSKGFYRKIIKNLIHLIFKKEKKFPLNSLPTVLNDSPKKDWVMENPSINLMTYNNSQKTNELYLIEILLLVAFLLRIERIQKQILLVAEKQTLNFIEKYNINYLICGHPTILMTFIGFYLAKKKRTIITVQHGIYNLKKYKVLWFEKKIATQVIVYGEYFRNMYEKQGIAKENLIIGSPYFSTKVKLGEFEVLRSFNPVSKKALFLGQQFYKVSNDIFGPYNHMISNLITYFEKQDITLYYKAHPREDINKSLNRVNISKLEFYKESTMSETYLNEFDVFYSVNSSLLLETYLQKKVCFQMNIPDFNIDEFSNYSGIPLLREDTIGNHLPISDYKFYLKDKYLNLSQNPKESLIGILEQIIKVE